MKVDLRYGQTGLTVDLPAECEPHIIRKPKMAILQNKAAAVMQALDQPVGCACLQSIAASKKTACILICDVTRPVPNGVFLRPVVEKLLSAGLKLPDITILVATGLHRPNEGEELARVVGDPWIMANVRVENHFARDENAHIDLGYTATRNTPVSLDRRFVEADIRIATGLVEPHFMAGYSGGRKVIAPGIAGEETIRTFHSAAFMADPNAVECNLVGNPLHEEQLQIVKMLGEVYAINTVIDEERNLVFINFGEVIQSHLQAVAFAHDCCVVEVDRRYNTVLTSAAGYPLDKTYYQTVKGMVTPLDIVNDGGTIIIASECGEGLGSANFRASQTRLIEMGADAFLQKIHKQRLAEVDEWQSQMQTKPTSKALVQLYSGGLPNKDHSLTGIERVASIESAIRRSIDRASDPVVAVIPEGPYVVPKFAGL